MLLSIVLVFVNVIFRQFNMGVTWTEELTRYLIVWITFIGASVCVREGSHISIDFLQEIVKGSWKKYLAIVVNIVSIIFSILLTYYAYFYLVDINSKQQMSPALGVPIVYFYSVIFISAILLLVRYISNLIILLRGKQSVTEELEKV